MPEYTSYITCPYCGDENIDSQEVETNKFEGDLPIQECPNCEKKFTAERQCEVTYSTYKLKKEI